MITRSQMRRQLRAQGGIMNVAPRKKFGIGSVFQDFKDKVVDRTRKIIPNELANVAVKAAPFVAMIPGYGPAAAGIMRGLGRLDQRGDLTDAIKQGLLTYGGGKVFDAGMRGAGLRDKGASGVREFFNEDTVQRGRGLFKGADAPKVDPKIPATPEVKPTGIMERATAATIDKIPFADKLPQIVKEKLLVGGITSGASALYSYFTGEFEPQEPGESMEEYMARRNTRVKQQMRGYMDSYYTPLRNPQYAAMSDEEKNNYIDSIVGQGMATGGRVGYQTGGISSANTLAENIARNRAAQSAFQQAINPSRQKIVERLQARQPKSSPLETFGKHAMVSEAMKGKTGMGVIPEYALQTGADFQMKFPGVNPKVSAGLASAYQTLQEGSRAILDGPGGITLKDAYNKAVDQTSKNIEGILAADTGTLTAKQQADRNKYLASQGQPTETMTAATPTPDAGTVSQEGLLEGVTRFKNPNPRFSGDEFLYSVPGVEGELTQSTYDGYVNENTKTMTEASKLASATEREKYENLTTSLGEKIFPTYDDYLLSMHANGLLPNPPEFYKDKSDTTAATPTQDLRAGIKEAFATERLSGGELFGDAIPDFDKYGTYTGSDQLIKDYAAAGRGTPSSQLVRLPEGHPYAVSGPGYYEYDGTSFSKTADLDMTSEYEKMIRSNYGLATGGRVGLMGGTMPMGEPRVNQGGITELDFRAKGGFVPVGIKEKADDVPAMLSKNEFVFTADAVRGAGNGSVEKGAQKMYDTMKNLERRVT